MTQEIIDQHLKTIRLGAIAQEERRQAAIKLGELLDSEELKAAALSLRVIERDEADFVIFQNLQRQERPLWQYLNEALTGYGYPPATTVDEAFQGIGKPTAQQKAVWYGDAALEYIQDKIQAEPGRAAEYLDVLGYCGSESAIEIIAPFTQDSDRYIRMRAFSALGNLQGPEAQKLLIDAAENEQDVLPSQAIANALGNFLGTEIVDTLAMMLNTNKGSRKEAGRALIKLDQVELVVQTMNTHKEKNHQYAAAQALAMEAETHPEVIDYLLIAAQSHPYYMVRLTAIQKLGEVKEERVFDVLAKIVQEQGYSVRIAALESLVISGDRAIPIIEQALDDATLPEWAAKRNEPTVGQRAAASIAEIRSG